mmetsp:Transcript_8520/g.20121  ORF Transcript_8520/g.20121 Transcript_8520/m.20121 type:complete len:234 (+) Transcript_8520:543-1244(+)
MVAVSKCLLFSGLARTTPTLTVSLPCSESHSFRWSANSLPSMSSRAMSISTGANFSTREPYVLSPPIILVPCRPIDGPLRDLDRNLRVSRTTCCSCCRRSSSELPSSSPSSASAYCCCCLYCSPRRNSLVAKSLSRTHPPATRSVVVIPGDSYTTLVRRSKSCSSSLVRLILGPSVDADLEDILRAVEEVPGMPTSAAEAYVCPDEKRSWRESATERAVRHFLCMSSRAHAAA